MSGPRASTSSGSSRQPISRIGADPLLDWDANDLDAEELEDIEVTSGRPMLVDLEIDSNVVGQCGGRPLWRREFDGIGVEGEEVISLMDQKGKNTALSARFRPMGMKGNGELLPHVRQSSTSTVGEGDGLFVDAYRYGEDSDGYSGDLSRTSVASRVGFEAREVAPRRTSYSS